MTDADRTFDALFSPRSIAVIGASDDPEKIGGRSIAFLWRYGYRGEVYPVNPRRPTVQGRTAYPEVAAVPGEIDLAVVATPAATVRDTVAACAARGVRVCALLTSGFGEMSDDGRRAQEDIAALAAQSGMRVLGPNCQGAANLAIGAVTSFSTCFADHHVRDGAIAIVSQSGAVAGMLTEIQDAHPTGIRYWVATGNESDVGVPELVGWTLRDPDVRVVEAYCENLQDVAALADAARYAASAGKAILMVKSGATPEGRRAAGSHTGALAQDEAVVGAFLRAHGIVRADGLGRLADYARVFTVGNAPRGDRVAILSNSGGLGVMMADRCRAAGLRLAEFAPRTRERLNDLLPEFAATGNPVDVTAQLLNDSRLLSRVLPVLAADPNVDVIIPALGMLGQGYDVAGVAEDIVAVHTGTDRLVAAVLIGGRDGVVDDLSRRGVPAYADDAACVDSVAAFVRHHARLRDGAAPPEPAGTPDAQAALPAPGVVRGPDGFLSEYEGQRLMRSWGLPVVEQRLVHEPEEAVVAAAELGYPVVMKVSSPAAPHKTELGLVELDLRDAGETRRAARELLDRAKAAGVDPLDGLLVARMVTGALPVSVGATWDDTFGPMVLVGSGGIHVEAKADFRLLFPPFGTGAVTEALAGLDIAPMLADLRGVGALDGTALAELVATVGRRYATTDGRLPELDLNPVFVGRDGAVVADVLVRTA